MLNKKGNEKMNTNLVINTSKIRGYKKAFYAVSLILIFAISIAMAFVPTASAQSGVTGVSTGETTSGFVTVAPTLIGVGQILTVNTWVFPLPTTYNYSSYWNGFYGLTVTFTRPDGTKDTFMPTDGTGEYAAGQTQGLGALFFYYTPEMAGNWSVSFTLPAQSITWADGTVKYAGCTSNTFAFTVQTGIVLAGLLNGYPWAQLPNANVYWSYPINDNNREWDAIAGDWTGISVTSATVVSPYDMRWQPYGPGPGSAHIVWDRQLKEGGIIAGNFGTISYYTGTVTGIVMDGNEYINIPNSVAVGQAFGQFECISLATGQVLYTANGTITAGIDLPGSTYQQSSTAVAVGEAITTLASSYGSYQYPYLFGTVTVNNVVYWMYYDPLTGALMREISNCGSAKLIDGTILAFGAQAGTSTTDTALNGYLYRWNETTMAALITTAGVFNWNNGITWKVPLPLMAYNVGSTSAPSTLAYPALFAISPDLSTVVIGTKNQYWGYNANTGALVWNLTVPYAITSNEEIPLGQVNDFIIFDAVAATFHCYSETTGALLWTTPSFASSPWATTWTVYNTETNDLNNMYIAFPDGSERAYSLTDGHLIWTSMPFASTEYANNAVPYCYAGVVMEGGLIYAYAGYSTLYQIDPVSRFAMMTCTNATNGNIVYALNGGVDPLCAANGYVIGFSIFDGKQYCVGKGTSSTTVTAQQQVGGSVLIQGSVLDKSPASSDAAIAAVYPNGVPAISDANMSVWMDYLHMQNSTLLNAPPNCIGVPVSLTAIAPDGTSTNIGAVTSDGTGQFAYQWTPTTTGLYTIYATFAGSNSYFESYGETHATVASTTTATATPAATPTPAPTTTSTASNVNTNTLAMYIAIGVIAMIIAVAIATVLILRKKP